MSSMINKPKAGSGIASLLRDAGRKAKLESEQRPEIAVDELLGEMATLDAGPRDTRRRPIVPKIFSVIDYIEAPWGLKMNLYPVQRFIIKLYYNVPLNDRDKTIKITDMFNTRTLYNFTEKEYLKFLYDSGRCNFGEQAHDRRQLILAIGRRGSKCLRAGTLVLTDKGVLPIEQLGDARGAEFQPLDVAVAQEGGGRSRSAFFYVGGVKPTIAFRTHSGYGVEGTPNHRIRVMSEDGTIEWRRLDELRIGDQIGIHRGTNLWVSDQLDVRPYHNDDGRKAFDFPSYLDENYGLLLGLLVGDGSWTNPTSVAMTVGDAQAWDAYKAVFTRLFGDYRIQPDRRTDGTGRLEIHGVGMRRFLHALGWTLDAASDTKRVPWSVLRSPRSVVCAFLRGLFDTDGGVPSGRKIALSSASKGLIEDVQILLLNLGITSHTKKVFNQTYQKDYFYLNVVGTRSRALFAEHIGFMIDRKDSPLQCAAQKLGSSVSEAIPHQKAWASRLLASVPKNNARKGLPGWRRSVLREALGNVCKPSSREDLSYLRLPEVISVAREIGADSELIRHFEALAEADYFYDPVTDLQHGEAEVFDLNVPDGASFVAAGVTNHNTTMSSLFASYEVYRLLNMHDPQAYYGLPSGNTIQIISIATDKDQAGILFREVSGHLSRCEYFQPYILSNNLSRIDFQTPADIEKFGPNQRQQDGKFASLNGKSSIRVTFKGAIAKGLRGMGNIVVILDEMAHFLNDGSTSAEEVYTAVTPSMAAFSPKSPDDNLPVGPVESRLICISSPMNKEGKFYELFQTAMAGGKAANNMIAIQAPTWEINPTVPADYYEQKFHEDPSTFMVEHGAEFSDRTRGWIEREIDLLACIDSDLRPKERGVPRAPHQMGVDVAVTNDGTSIAITHVEDDTIVLDYHEIWYAGVDWREANPHLGEAYSTPYTRKLKEVDRIDFDEIAAWIEALSKKFFITEGIFDRWEGLSLEQQLHKRGLKQFTSEFFTKDFSSRMYQTMKLLMFDQKLKLYDYPVIVESGDEKTKHSPLITELLTLQATQQSKNIIVVEAPNTGDLHDDQSDALVRSVWLSNKHIGKGRGAGAGNRPAISRGTTLAAYQLGRARMHGGFSPRMVPGRLGSRRSR